MRKAYLERSEMDYAVNVWVLGEDLVEIGLVGDVHRVELGTLAGEELNAVDAFFGGIVQVVNNDDFVASLEEGEDGERADVAHTTKRRSVSMH